MTGYDHDHDRLHVVEYGTGYRARTIANATGLTSRLHLRLITQQRENG